MAVETMVLSGTTIDKLGTAVKAVPITYLYYSSATKASIASSVKCCNQKEEMFCLVYIHFDLFQFFQEPLQFVLELIVAADAEVVADTAAIGRDGLVVRDAVKAEQLLQTGEVGIGDECTSFLTPCVIS